MSDRANEIDPLLKPVAESPGDHEALPSSEPATYSREQLRIVALCALLAFISNATLALQSAPYMRLYEARLCSDYYGSNGEPVPEDLCKIQAVQDQLAKLVATKQLMDGIPGLLLTLPVVEVTKNFDYRKVLLCSISAIWMALAWPAFVCTILLGSQCYLNLPIRMVWLSAGILMLGGSFLVLPALIHTVVAETVDQTSRTSCFFYVGAASLLANMASLPAAAAAMKINTFFPIILSLFVHATMLLIIPRLPERRREVSLHKPTATRRFRLRTFLSKTRQGIWMPVSKSGKVLRDPMQAIIILAFAVMMLDRALPDVLMPYVSYRYHWSLSSVGYLLTVQAGTNLAMLLVLLPIIRFILLKRTQNVLRTELFVCIGSIAAEALGFFLLAAAPKILWIIFGLMTLSLGVGLSATLRSLAVMFIREDQVALLFGLVGLAESIASTLSGPLLTTLWMAGINLKGQTLGLPFYFASSMFSLLGFAVLVIVRQRAASGLTDRCEADGEDL